MQVIRPRAPPRRLHPGGPGLPAPAYKIRAGGEEVGRVTSGTFSPILDRGIGMGYVSSARAKPGTAIRILIRDREVPATVVSLPFIKK